jgi:hypothetical protein
MLKSFSLCYRKFITEFVDETNSVVPSADTKYCYARLTLNTLQIFFLGFNDLHIGL